MGFGLILYVSVHVLGREIQDSTIHVFSRAIVLDPSIMIKLLVYSFESAESFNCKNRNNVNSHVFYFFAFFILVY